MKETSFARRVRDAVRQIPKGKTKSYGDVARAAGYPGAARAVGMVMKRNYDPSVPCHRVIRADGALGGYNRGGLAEKRALLKAEGVRL
ncbi:TPA: 6-O-methylguanine DNA methyltransferase [Candidatus Kaiserbacteria bacterium]|nr:MAG: cysteine methyltransferase [Parcubacteria group bacterium GW2011_GWA1_56_13]HCR52296.1 6-O-methylguanine DNA methyltransferase [Candidatus Kaiserbacteria bacterium]